MSLPPETRQRRVHLAVLALVAALVQLGFHATYSPWWCGDSMGYASPASILYGSGFTHYLGERTPGYPLFLLGCELLAGGRIGWVLSPRSAEVVTWAQSGLAVASVVLVYLAVERLGVRRRINLAVCLVYALLVGPAETAIVILSENVCLFLLILATYLVVLAVDRWRRGKAVSGLALAAGLTYGFAVLVRPNMLFLWVVVTAAAPLLVIGGRMWRRKLDAGILSALTRPLLAGGALPLVIWLFVRYETEGVFTLTEMTDLTRTSAAYNLFDRVHPQDKLLGDIMVKYYRQTNWPGHVDRSYIFVAFPEISAHSGAMPVPVPRGYESFRAYALYAYIGHVSNELLLENPGVWAQNSLGDLESSFDFRLYQPSLDETKDPMALPQGSVVISRTGWRIVSWLGVAQAPVILLGYLLTFAALAMGVFRTRTTPDLAGALMPLSVSALAVGTIVCVIAPCVLAAYYTRFSVPLIPIFALCSAYAIEQGMIVLKTKDAEAIAPAPFDVPPNPKA